MIRAALLALLLTLPVGVPPLSAPRSAPESSLPFTQGRTGAPTRSCQAVSQDTPPGWCRDLPGYGATVGAPLFAPATGASSILGGLATWYATGPGGFTAAAGPDLRQIRGWRGSFVRVTSGRHSVVVRLIDACWCPDRNGKAVLLDLSILAFEKLADATRGVIPVTVEWLGRRAPVAPRSDTAP